MAGRSTLELAVGTGKWDSGLRKAQQTLSRFVQANGGLEKALAKNSDGMGKFVKMMGDMNSTATTAKGKMSDYKKAIEQLTSQYNSMDAAQKKALGHEYTSAIDKLKGKYREAADEVAKLNRELNGVAANNEKAASGGGLLSGIAGQMGISPSMLTGAGATVAGFGMLAGAIRENVRTAATFEESLSRLSSLTGKTGKDLEELKGYAIELGSSTTLSASQVSEAFMMIGSQQPQLLASGEALRDVTKAAITLSEAAGIELSTAAQSLSTSINQFGGNSANAARFVNVLAAASQKGAGDISFLGEAISKSGVLANAVGASYEELVANLEQLAQAGIDAGTSGTALRSIIANLEKQSNSQFKPSVVGLTQAFENLGRAQLSITDYVSIAGKQFFSQAMILADNAQKAKELQKEITGTNTAEEQAATNVDNLNGSLKQLASAWEGLNLTINSSNGILKTTVDFMTTVIQRYTAIINKMGELYDRARDLVGMGRNVIGDSAGTYGKTLGDAIGKASTPPPTPTEPISYSGGGSTKKGKKSGKSGTGAHKQTPAEKAEEQVASALRSYAETIHQADLRFEAGLDDELDHKKKELQALSSLMGAYGKASAIYDDPKYRTAYAEAADRYKSLAKAVADSEEAQKALKEEEKKTAEWLKSGDKESHGVIKMGGGGETLQQQVHLDLANSITEADMKTLRNLLETALKDGMEGISIPTDMLTQLFSSQDVPEGFLEDFVKRGMSGVDILEGLINGMFGESVNIPDEFWMNLVNQFNEKRKEMGLDTISLDLESGGVSKDGKQSGGGGLTELTSRIGKLTDGVSNITGGLEQMGVKIPEGLNQAIGVIQGLMSVVQGVQTVIQVFATSSQAANTIALGANTAMVSALTTIMAAKTATSFIPFLADGGVARAAGGLLSGNHMSGDNVPVMVNSGELILNRAQQGNIASQLEGGVGTIQMEAKVYGEDIMLATRNVDRRRGKGEVVRSR